MAEVMSTVVIIDDDPSIRAALGSLLRSLGLQVQLLASVQELAAGIMRVSLDTGVPIVFGVLTTDDLDQALARCGGAVGNKGEESAATAVEMVSLLRQISPRPSEGPASEGPASEGNCN